MVAVTGDASGVKLFAFCKVAAGDHANAVALDVAGTR